MLSYKGKRVYDIISRETGKTFDLTDYAQYIQFGNTQFVLYLYPELKSQLTNLEILYNNCVANSDDYEENFYTSNLEGANISTINETREICNERIVKGKKEGMVLGYSKAVEVFKDNPSLRCGVELANKVQEAITMYFNENAKAGYRDNSVYVGTQVEVIFKPCDCVLIDTLYPKVFYEYTDNAFVNTAIQHLLLVNLHPYFDGNGRTARLMQKEYLIEKGYSKFKNLSISKYIHQSVSKYHKSIRLTEEEDDLTHFVAYMLNIYEDLFTDNLNVLNKSKASSIEGGVDMR